MWAIVLHPGTKSGVCELQFNSIQNLNLLNVFKPSPIERSTSI